MDVGDGAATSVVGPAIILGVGDGAATSVVGPAIILGVGDGAATSVVGSAIILGVGDGAATSVVGSAIILGVGDGAATSVVGSAVVWPEDALTSGSSEPPQASSSNGRITTRTEIPRKGLGVFISIHSMFLWARDGTAGGVWILAHGGKLPASSRTRPSGWEPKKWSPWDRSGKHPVLFSKHPEPAGVFIKSLPAVGLGSMVRAVFIRASAYLLSISRGLSGWSGMR